MAVSVPSTLIWRVRGRELRFNGTARIMGILNVTPDSFSDGGRYLDAGHAMERGLHMVREGACMLDIGGESSRPGAESVPVEEEARRVVPVIAGLAAVSDVLLSVDTTKAAVADRALAAGAHIVNDISAGTADPGMAEVIRKHRAGVVLMHMQGTPKTMQSGPIYNDVVDEVTRYLEARLAALTDAGLDRESLAVDPGLGFGKTVEHNVALLRGLPRLVGLGRPVLVGASRKSFLGRLTGCDVHDRLAPSLAALAYAVQRGAHMLRVHDVKESCEVAQLLAKFGLATEPPVS